MDPHAVQIPPPIFKKQKQSIVHDVIDIVEDNKNDDDDLMILDEITRKHNKGKVPEALHEGYGDKSRRFMKYVRSKVKSAFFGSKKHGLAGNPDAMKPPYLGQFGSAKPGAGSSSSFHSDLVGENGSLHPSGVESGNLWSKSSYSFVATPKHVHGSTSALKSARDVHKAENETLRKLRSFKQFDIVIDTSDHHFIKHNSSTKQNPKSWAKKIQEEWKILEKHLPDTIFVRVYESRMDLMRAVIIGAEGTPYHDGLFFFDIFFPSSYPNVPPKVHYHSGGLRINPNLYSCGRVCLSLLNTWSGSTKEKWTKGVSTILQVLVSIQGLILNTQPYFNEPGYEHSRGTPNGEKQAQQYNEKRFILSLRTMMYTIRKPPKNFEDLVVGHFYSRAHDILASCKAYMNGVQVGCLVKGGVQDVNGSEGKQSSAHFISGLAECMPSLVQEFEKVGVNDCKIFTSPPVPRSTPRRKLFCLTT
ncbi:putative ubiquitin-conjugating enzyme E2 38 [Vicia villosa]|uniref:putative ubiquitin-conjugating enzyme E2 38 n=1 Tax=Vicia villosa TaxID=3911 RepID=UPI00273CEFF9|nr:putative ubiquitin-conjugating enzyme E2 38 [Vicia villosa]